MPLYEYQCPDCGRVFEVFTQRLKSSIIPSCPGCGQTNVERLLSPFAGKASGDCGTSSFGFG